MFADNVAICSIRGAFEYAGQKCSATARMYVPESLWPEVSGERREEGRREEESEGGREKGGGKEGRGKERSGEGRGGGTEGM